jgi:hypothetical protein
MKLNNVFTGLAKEDYDTIRSRVAECALNLIING